MAQIVKTLPAVRDTWVPSLGWQDPVEEGMNTPSSILAWRILMDRGACHGVAKRATVMGSLLSDLTGRLNTQHRINIVIMRKDIGVWTPSFCYLSVGCWLSY